MFKNLFSKKCGIFILSAVSIFGLTAPFSKAAAQTANTRRASIEPRRDVLLNGLQTITIYQPSSDKINFRLRLHYGSAFDPSGKEGLMQMFAESLFSNEQRNAFRELEGDFKVRTTYDYLEFEGSGNAENFVSLLDIFREALASYAPTAETVGTLRERQIAKIKELDNSVSHVAERAAAQKLFGTFPYGRPAEGTADSVAKIDRADLILARDRFLKADFATFAFTGGVSPSVVSRAAKQILGSWQKSEKVIPSTFAVPVAAEDAKIATVASPNEDSAVALAWRGVARNDAGFYASQILTRVWQMRLANSGAIVENRSMFLPGYIILLIPNGKLNADGENAPMLPPNAANFDRAVTSEEFTRAQAALIADVSQKSSNVYEMISNQLDTDTYRLNAPPSAKSLESVTLADVQKLSDALGKQKRFAAVAAPLKKTK